MQPLLFMTSVMAIFFPMQHEEAASPSDSYCRVNLNQSWIINYGRVQSYIYCALLYVIQQLQYRTCANQDAL